MSSDDAIYGTWNKAGGGCAVKYTIAVFHEIEFVVNENYRRIPYGGIENGGLLFGRRNPEGIEVTAFRTIECEHASGPAFILSDKDIQGIKDQLQNYKNDADIGSLEVLGWFISHSRSDLTLTEQENKIFSELFAEAWQVTLLVKPEKFKATRFAFVVREPDKPLERDLADDSFVLPLPAASERDRRPDSETGGRRRRPRVQEIRHELSPVSSPGDGPSAARETHPTFGKPTPETRDYRQQPAVGGEPHSQGPHTQVHDPSAHIEVRTDHLPLASPPASEMDGSEWIYSLAVIAGSILVVCISGLWFYANYLMPPLMLSISPVSGKEATILWPRDQTVNAESAILTVWQNGSRQDHMLTQDQMQAGAFVLRDADQAIVQLWTHVWYVNRYGMVRAVTPPITPPLPPAPPSRSQQRRLR